MCRAWTDFKSLFFYAVPILTSHIFSSFLFKNSLETPGLEGLNAAFKYRFLTIHRTQCFVSGRNVEILLKTEAFIFLSSSSLLISYLWLEYMHSPTSHCTDALCALHHHKKPDFQMSRASEQVPLASPYYHRAPAPTYQSDPPTSKALGRFTPDESPAHPS